MPTLVPLQLTSGEKVPVYAQVVASSGTLTILASPAGSVTVYNAEGNPLPAHTAQPLTGFEPTALSKPRAWYLFDTTGLAAGLYTVIFTLSVKGSDNLTRRRVIKRAVEIVGVPGRVATYVPSTDVGYLRTMLRDTDLTDPVWFDEELQGFLTRATVGGVVDWNGAIGHALLAEANDNARLAVVLRHGSFNFDPSKARKALLEQAQMYLRASRLGIDQLDPIKTPFTLTDAKETEDGSMEVW